MRSKKHRLNVFLIALSVLPTFALASEARGDGGDEKPIRALLICGGCCHDYTNLKNILTQGVSARANVQWTIAQEGDTREHKHSIYSKPQWWKGYDVVVHYECFGFVNDDAFVEAIVKVHADGVPVVALHCAVHSYRTAKTTAWSEMLGIRSLAHGKRKPIAVTFTNKEHAITKNMAAWTTAADELYNNIKVYDKAVPLATGRQGDEEAVVVWTNEFNGTRVFCTTLGHDKGTVTDERYLDLVTRGLLWSVDKLGEQHLKPAKKVLIDNSAEAR